jgi:salicylate hydroxylase
MEDGATLAAVLAGSDSRNVHQAPRVYEQLRLPRTSRVQTLATNNKTRFQMPDGLAQRHAQLASGSDWNYGITMTVHLTD